ncbi:MAG TPA: hypothetical protein VJY35_13990 [Candidatus Eisenbacteria bacterium]|nr:hypothetical protein [Candidatus Eisenbacteria bacterium]
MVPIMSLWLPILISAVFVFIASSIIHMVLPYHRSDYGKLPAEDAIMDDLRKHSLPPGDYMLPCPGGADGMRSEAFKEKMKKGPRVLMTVLPGGMFNMGPQLAQWFVFCLVVAVIAAYVTGRAVPAGTPYLTVFRFAGTTAFIGHCLAQWPNTIWYKRKASTSLKQTFDGLVYGLLTAGTFGWLWPR